MKITSKTLKKMRKLTKEWRKVNKVYCPVCKEVAGNWLDNLPPEDDDKWVYCGKCKIRLL